MISESHRRIIRELVQDQFLNPESTNLQYLIELVEICVKSVVEQQGTGPTYPYTLGAVPISTAIESAEIPCNPANVHDAISHVYQHLQGIVKANHPFMVKNIIPTPSLVHLVVNLAVSLYMPNGVTGEDAAESVLSEVRCAAALSKLLGYDPWQSAGVFTFGGTGTNLYAVRVGLQKADKNYSTDGYKGDCVVVSSWPAHFSQQNVAIWLGIGLNNYIQAKSNQDQTTDLTDLELKCKNAIFAGKKLACIIGVGGSTSNMAIDDFSEICAIRDNLVEEHNLN